MYWYHLVISSTNVLCLVVEDGAAIDKSSVMLSHGLCTGLGTENAIIALPKQFRSEERVVLVCLNFLTERAVKCECKQQQKQIHALVTSE